MLETTLILCAENIILDRKSNSISAISIVEQINSSGFPVFYPKLYVLGIFRRTDDEPETHSVKIRIDCNEQNVVELDVPLNFQGNSTGKVVAEISNVAIPQPGLLHAKFNKESENLATYSIDIKEMTPPEGKVQVLNFSGSESSEQ